ncbi:MAG: tetratricopeptide repeat protein [Leptospiraceae bacterium]|jgi:tetratricopeptide (TPR) repeat protein|nr:tetratricopeptide repeat protein [Leptospiraceae bacterium]
MTQQQLQLLEQYNKALALYKQRKFQEALEEFKKALQIVPDDGPSKLYVERCLEYIKNPPPEDWDGVFVMKTK